ncbi:hypothetical protein UK23_40970 [Lentzea aerocolonigenes]|uniref:Uncharacterized protein n=1 Tax=Lentzea aerocolonigenes TaxID=68170 RepID=A0A0F0GJX2_LENAE|nr:hypothetical protein UK23_40970 [Lentzea aerocolonigenes]
MDLDVVVLWVRTGWTKASRGGREAARRNAVPEAFALPHGRAAVHEVVQVEWRGFEPEWREERDSIDPISLSLREEDDVLAVQLHDTMLAPPRRVVRPSPVRLGRGEWVRWQVNHRWTRPRDGGWNYELTTLNLAYGAVADLKLFMGTPTRFVDERAALR